MAVFAKTAKTALKHLGPCRCLPRGSVFRAWFLGLVFFIFFRKSCVRGTLRGRVYYVPKETRDLLDLLIGHSRLYVNPTGSDSGLGVRLCSVIAYYGP